MHKALKSKKYNKTQKSNKTPEDYNAQIVRDYSSVPAMMCFKTTYLHMFRGKPAIVVRIVFH